MNIAVIVDIDTDRKSGHQIKIQQVSRTINDELVPTDDSNTIELMAALCEGICTLIHCADHEGVKPSYQSVRDCIKHITDGFADASYKGQIIKADEAQADLRK